MACALSGRPAVNLFTMQAETAGVAASNPRWRCRLPGLQRFTIWYPGEGATRRVRENPLRKLPTDNRSYGPESAAPVKKATDASVCEPLPAKMS